MQRRSFLAALAGGPALDSLPALAQSPKNGRLKISSVEIWRLEGRREAITGGPPRQQVNPIHIYEDQRPRPGRLYHIVRWLAQEAASPSVGPQQGLDPLARAQILREMASETVAPLVHRLPHRES